MTYEDIKAITVLSCYLWWAVMAAPGWVLPLRDGAPRYTFRYMAWGGFLAASLLGITPWRWLSIAFALTSFWAIERVSHWWGKAEQARSLG